MGVLACETDPNIDLELTANKAKLMVEGANDFGSRSPSSDLYQRTCQENRARQTWHQIVEAYTLSDLTFRQDMLPALQGVARRVQDERQCSYYAGLWEDDMCNDLLWYTRSPSQVTQQVYRAPSWSWASTEGGVRWILQDAYLAQQEEKFKQNPASYYKQRNVSLARRGEHLKHQASVVSVHISPAGQDPLGEIIAGELRVKALWLRAVILREPSRSSRLHAVIGFKGHLMYPIVGWYEDSTSSKIDKENVVLILITTTAYCACFIVLAPVDEPSPAFRRVGFARHFRGTMEFDKTSDPYTLFENLECDWDRFSKGQGNRRKHQEFLIV